MAIARPPVSNVWGNLNTSSPDMVTPSYIDTGFPAPSGVPVKPPRGYVNWLFNWGMAAGRYLLSRALNPWDSTETQYTAGSCVQDTDGHFYVARGVPITGTHPSADPSNWFPLNMLDRVLPVGSGGDWTSKIATWLSPTGRAGFTLDRWGIPRTNFYQHKETWSQFFNWSGISLGGGGGIQLPWKFPGSGAASILTGHAAGVAATLNASATAPSLELVVDGSSNSNSIAAVFQPMSTMSTNAHMIAEFESAFINDPTNYGGRFGFMGVSNTVLVITDGAYFYAFPGNANWKCVSISANVSTVVDSGIPIVAGTSGAVDLIVELVGGSITDDFTPHALFYINGVLVANITTNVPNSSGSPVVGCLVAGTWRSVSTGGTNSIVLGPVTYTQTTKIATP